MADFVSIFLGEIGLYFVLTKSLDFGFNVSGPHKISWKNVPFFSLCQCLYVLGMILP